MKNNKAKKLLLIVDMVKGFVDFGPMSSPAIKRIVPNCIREINAYRDKGYAIGFICDSHPENAIEFNRFPVHCVENTAEAEITDDLKYAEAFADIVFRKNATSAMFAKGFIKALEEMTDLEEVEIIGCCTDICVMNLAIILKCYFDEMNRNIRVIIPKDAVDTYDSPTHNREEWNEMAFRFLVQAGIEII